MTTEAGTEPNAETPYFGRLQRRLDAGEFAVTAEVVPPRGATLAGIRRLARVLHDWVDAADVTDGQSAETRMASWAGSLGLLQEDVEPVIQLQCRDRNRIALQADLLGAAAVGIPNVLLLTGDDPRFGDDPDAKPVFDLDSVELIRLARRLRDEAHLLSGRKLSEAPRWFIGGVENPAVQHSRIERLCKKIAAGAQFVQTQFTFDVPLFAGWMEQVRDLGLDERCFIIAGVGPIRTLRALAYLRHLPGVYIPDEVARRLTGTPPERREAEALALCAETIEQLRAIPGVAGLHIVAAGWESFVPEVLSRAGVGRRPPLAAEARPPGSRRAAVSAKPASRAG